MQSKNISEIEKSPEPIIPAEADKRILAVDDNPVMLNTLKTIIGSRNYKLSAAMTGKAALRYLETHAVPDLILLDVEMPDMSGYDLIKKIKSNAATSHIPVIFLTAKNDDDNELEGLTLGAIDYISKSTPPELLLKRIEVHLLVEAQKQRLVSQQQELMFQKQQLTDFNENLQQMVDEQTEKVTDLKNTVLKTMSGLVEYRDDITGGHIDRTQSYISIMFDAMQKQGVYESELLSYDIELVMQSAQLHDVGKIAIRDNILLKPDKLTDEEFEQIKQHTTIGKKIIEQIQEGTTEQTFLEYAKTFAETHHEKWNGKGYPNGLAGDRIPLLGRVMAIADVYDALVSERPYKRAFSHEEAVQIIADDKGKHFDPVLINVFLSVSDEFKNLLHK